MTALAQASQQTIKPSFQRKNHDALHSVKAVFVPQSSIQASRHADSEAGDLIIDLSKVSPASSHPKNLGYGMSRILFLPRFSVTSFSLCPLTAECGQLPSPACVYTGVPTGRNAAHVAIDFQVVMLAALREVALAVIRRCGLPHCSPPPEHSSAHACLKQRRGLAVVALPVRQLRIKAFSRFICGWDVCLSIYLYLYH